MTLPSLLWWSAPLLALPWSAPAGARGRAMARLLITGFGVGALYVGVGSLAPGEVAGYAALRPDNAMFVSLTVGLMLGALGPWPPPVDWRGLSLGLPLMVVLLVSVGSRLQLAPLGLGAVLGALPLFAGLALPGGGYTSDTNLQQAAPGWWLAITLAIAAAEPLLLIAALPLPWLLPGRRAGWPDSPWSRRVMPMIGFILLLATLWLALTVAGTPWARLSNYSLTAPLSEGAERLLAVLAIGALVALTAPWPLRRLAPALVPMPALVLLAWRVATELAPTGVAAWLAGTAMLLVPAALIAALCRQWRTALGSLALVGGLTGTVAGLASGLVLAGVAVLPSLRPVTADRERDRVTFFGSPWLATLVAAALAGVTVALLEVEVVMATVLAGGVATLLGRPPGQSPPPSVDATH
jgi:hypothetical protein